MTAQKKTYLTYALCSICIISILIAGFFLRSFHRDWDQNSHLHPDERFLTMVGNAAKLPTTFVQYLDPESSLLNPRNLNFSFYVYGNFPIIFQTYLTTWMSKNNYQDFTLIGRSVSAILDTGVILLIFLIVKEAEKKYNLSKLVKYLAALLYAISVLPIQLSHFFSVDSFTQFFGWLAIYFALRFHLDSRKKISILFSGVFCGLAMASKISGVLFLPLVTVLLFRFQDLTLPITFQSIRKLFFQTFLIAVVWGWFTYFTLRLASPYYFADSNFFHLALHPKFLANLKELQGWNNPNIWFPPGVQWASASVLMPIKNIIFYGLGVPFALFAALGLIFLIRRMWKWSLEKPFFLIMTGWTVAFLIYYSFQYVKTMRYLQPIYPVFAIFAGFGIYHLSIFIINFFVKSKSFHIMLSVLIFTNLLMVLIWPLAFLSIYIQPHSRIQASDWVYRNLPQDSTLAKEHWDDGIPFGKMPINKKFQGVELAVFNQDTAKKMQVLNEQLAQTDYYILSSNRAWKSISDAPQKYPLMSKFYSDLFANKTNFRLINEFHSYPSLRYLGIPIDFDDSNAEEAFTVYDHPTVYVFEKK